MRGTILRSLGIHLCSSSRNISPLEIAGTTTKVTITPYNSALAIHAPSALVHVCVTTVSHQMTHARGHSLLTIHIFID